MGRPPNFWWIISTLVIAGHFDGKNDAIGALNFEFPFLSTSRLCVQRYVTQSTMAPLFKALEVTFHSKDQDGSSIYYCDLDSNWTVGM